MNKVHSITTTDAWRFLRDGKGRLIDVREPGEFRGVRAAGALNFPLSTLEENVSDVPPGDPVYILCAAGSRAIAAAKIFSDCGRGASVVIGGMTEWQRQRLPVERGTSQVWSMERQVRLGAGLLVLLGVIVGWGFHPGFYGIAAFVGAGLAFSGLTGTCGMAMLLARCPWNR